MSKMKLRLISTAFAISLLSGAANAQVTIDMAAFTCGQYLAMSPAMSRDFSAWMSGWFSYQTRSTVVDVLAHEKNIAKLKSWCEFRPQTSVMTALQSAIGPQ
jgi:HdeA/HdeB family